MLLSHRTNTPGFGSASVTLDRALAPGFIVRRATFRELVQDDRITKPVLGVDSERKRHRIVVVLQGRTCESVDGVETTVCDGQAFYASAQAVHAGRTDASDVIEIEWDPGTLDDGAASLGSFSRTTLAPASRRSLTFLSAALRDATNAASVTAALADALDALRAEGLPVRADAAREVVPARPRDQLLLSAMDTVLSDFSSAPMIVDLETTLRCSGRTLARHIGDLHARYGLLGRGAGRFRGIRDSLRLVLASVYLSHESATPAAVSSSVGYGSVEALDHAFRDAGLPAPRALRRAITAAA